MLEEEIKTNEIAKLLKSFYFLKDKTFEYEYRLLYFSPDSGLYSKINFDYIKKIIFGIRCSDDTRYLIDCINKQVYNNKIKLYKIDDNFREVSYETKLYKYIGLFRQFWAKANKHTVRIDSV